MLIRTIFSEGADARMDNARAKESLAITFRNACLLHYRTVATVFSKNDNPNILSFVYAELVFLCRASRQPAAMDLIYVEYPWEELVAYLNTLLD